MDCGGSIKWLHQSQLGGVRCTGPGEDSGELLSLLSLPGKARLILLSLKGRETASVVCQAETGKLSIDSTFRRQSDRLGTVRRK